MRGRVLTNALRKMRRFVRRHPAKLHSTVMHAARLNWVEAIEFLSSVHIIPAGTKAALSTTAPARVCCAAGATFDPQYERKYPWPVAGGRDDNERRWHPTRLGHHIRKLMDESRSGMDRHEAILDLWHTLCYLHPDIDPSAYVGGKVSWDWVCTTALHLPEDYPCHRNDAVELTRICRDRGLLTGPAAGAKLHARL